MSDQKTEAVLELALKEKNRLATRLKKKLRVKILYPAQIGRELRNALADAVMKGSK